MTQVAALTSTLFGGAVLLAACASRAPISAPFDAPRLASAAPAVVVTSAPPALASAAPPAIAPPPTGPGTIACGATRCRAGAELCCLGPVPRCAPVLTIPPDGNWDREVSARQKACATDRFLACDDAGDCGAGQTCCEETYETETESIYQGICSPLRAGRVNCMRAELCSVDDPRCARKDNACTDVNGTLRCQLPLQLRKPPRCGKAPCPAGMTCVEEEGGPTCTKGIFRNDIPLTNGVIECNRGRDCGEDESCYQNPQMPGRRCDFSIAGIDGLTEPTYCTGPEDCVASCRLDERAVPSCRVAAKQQSGHCECLKRCKEDTDCDGCMLLAVQRGNIDPSATAFCDQRKGACECPARRP
jgi:hypothetical protein